MLAEQTPEQRIAAERFQMYYRGWRHGARGSDRALAPGGARDDLYVAYSEGYDAGRLACETMLRAAADRYGYKPTILRGEEAADGS